MKKEFVKSALDYDSRPCEFASLDRGTGALESSLLYALKLLE